MSKLSKKAKVITIAGVSALLVGTAIATGVIFATRKKESPRGGGNNKPSIIPGDKPNFEPSVELSRAKFDSLNFAVSNLNSQSNKNKDIKLILINDKTPTKTYEKTVTISGDSLEVVFDKLEENQKYLLEIIFETSNKRFSEKFETTKRPSIHSTNPSSTNAVLTLNNLNDYKDDLKKIEITISNKTNPSAEPIKVSADELVIENGVARLNLKDSNLGLEPGNEYEATIKYNQDGESVNLSNPITITTPATTEVAYVYNASKNSITLYGIKDNSKKVILQYKLRATTGDFTSVTSESTPVSGKIEIPLKANLGFENDYVFQVKYEGSEANDLLTLEGNVKEGQFTTEPAPKISASTENGLDIKVDKLSPNIDKSKIFVYYKDKNKPGEWTKKPLSQVLDTKTNTLDIKDLDSNTNYETRLVYETTDGDSTKSTILSEAEFTTQKSFEFVLSRSFASSNKVLLSFMDNNKSETNEENKYTGATLKYIKNGDAMYNALQLTKKSVGDKTYAEANVSSLEEKTLYNWILVDEKQQTLASGTFKTGKAIDNQSNFVLVENNLTNGVKVSVANYYGFVESDGVKNYRPTDIQIKYFKNNKQESAQTETIKVSNTNIENSDYFSYTFNDLSGGDYTFELSYDSGYDQEAQLIKFKQSFNVNYELPEVAFNNEESKLMITNIESLNNKQITIKYKEENESSVFNTLSGMVSGGKLEIKLEGLKSNTEYSGAIEIAQDDLQTLSSIMGKTRTDFYGVSSDEKISLPYSFVTKEQNHSIVISEERYNLAEDKVDTKISLEGFKEHKTKNVDVTISKVMSDSHGVATDATPTSEQTEDMFGYDHEHEIIAEEKREQRTVNIEASGAYNKEKIIDNDLSNNSQWNDWAGTRQARSENGWFYLEFANKKDISAIGLYLGRDSNTGNDGQLTIYVETSEDGQTWTRVNNQSKITQFSTANSNMPENVISFSKVNTKYLRVSYRNRPSENNHFYVTKIHEMKVYPPKAVVKQAPVMTREGLISESGELIINDWFTKLDKNTKYKISVFDKTNSDTKIAEREYTSPNFSNQLVEELKTLNTNTSNPKLVVNNFEQYKKYAVDGYSLKLRAKKVTSDNPYSKFTSINKSQEFKGEIVFDFTDSALQQEGNDKVLTLDRITSDTNLRNALFEEKGKYQFVITLEKDSRALVLASGMENNLFIKNSNPPRINGEPMQTIRKVEGSNTFSNDVNLTLNALNDYNNEDNGITAYYIEANSPLASSSPEYWNTNGKIDINSQDHNSTVSFSNLKPDTVYKVAFVDKDGNVILSNDRVKTKPIPKLQNTTRGDVIMKYTLSNLRGAQSIIASGTYKILFSEDKSYSNSSNEVSIGDVQNFDGTYTFTLEHLKPNTTYNYKLVRGDETVLSYEDIFKTNKSQNEETVVGNDFASIKIVNPDYKLREGYYSIARKGTGVDADKMVLDLLKFQYSKDSNFSTDIKEFSVSLSENESDLLTLTLQNLDSNTKYYYRLVKGTAKSQIIKNQRSDSSAPTITWESDYPLEGTFTTLNITSNVKPTIDSATLTFENTNVEELNELGLKYKVQDNSNVYDVVYDYKINSGNIVFELKGLDKETIYDYTLFNLTTGKELSINHFSTKTDSKIKTALSHFDGSHVRFKLTNLDDFVGRNVRFVIKQKATDEETYKFETTLTNENNEFLWDVENLENLGINKNYKYDIYLLENGSNKVESLIDTGEFDSGSRYTGSGDLKVKTNIRTSGNYDLNKWYTVTTLQEIYSTEKTWKDNIQNSLQEIAVLGSNVVDATYGWHKLLVKGSDLKYSTSQSDKVVYKYIFVEPQSENSTNAIVKGIEFEFILVGNTIQVRILNAKSKPGTVDKRVNVSEYNWSQLTENIVYKAPNGVVNQSNKEISGDFISVGGFKFEATTVKRNSRDFSIPQIFRYSIEEANPALNKKTPSTTNNTAAGFVNLSNGAQEDKYGDFNNSSEFNYDIAYENYVLNNKELLPVNGNFMINASMIPGFSHMNKNLYTPGLSYDSQLRSKFFKLLENSGQIRFAGSDVSNRNWISFSSDDIIMFSDEEFANSDKYLTEFKLAKRLIWKDGNQLKGLRLTLSDSKDSHGALLGQLDDFVYYLDITKEIDLQSLSWETFISLATKHTTHKYMNVDSSGTAISGIRFVTKDESFISKENENKFINPQKAEATVAIESISSEGNSSRRLRMFNVQPGAYNIKIEYPIFYPTDGNREFTPVNIDINVSEGDSGYIDKDLSEYLAHNTEYKVTVTKDNQIIQVLSGINSQIPGGKTKYMNNNFKTQTFPTINLGGDILAVYNAQLNYYNSQLQHLYGEGRNGRKGVQLLNDFVRNREWSFLVGSPRFSDNQEEMRYKWSFKVQQPKNPHVPTTYYHIGNNNGYPDERDTLYSAALSDDGNRVIITRLFFGFFAHYSTIALSGVKEYNLSEDQKANINNLDIEDLYKDSSAKDITSSKFQSKNVTENDFMGANKGRVSLFGFYLKDKQNN